MKKTISLIIIAAMMLSMLAFTACGKSEFGVTENTEKTMTINAVNASKDSFFMVGSLEVADGEQITISGNLEKGEVFVEILGAPEDQSIDEVPETEGDPIITASIHTTDSVSGTVPAGSYFVKATCTEKATGTIDVVVEPAK